MDTLIFDVHGLIRIAVTDPPAALAARLRRDMASHQDVGAAVPDGAAVAVAPWPDSTAPQAGRPIPGTVLQFAVVRDGGQLGIGTLDRGRLTAAIFPGRTVRVAYDRRTASPRRVYGLLLEALRLALQRRGALLLHAACLSDGARSYLVVANRGSGKTRLVLSLLERGWSYIADDKTVLAAGRAYPFEPWIGIRDWHLEALPWLAQHLPPAVRRAKAPWRRRLRRGLGAWGARRLPKRLAAAWDERMNPAINVPVTALFPEAPQPPGTRIDAIVHLVPGAETTAHALPAGEALRRVELLQRIAVQGWYPLSELLAVSAGAPEAVADRSLYADSLTAAAGLELRLADEAEIGRVAARLAAADLPATGAA